MSFRIGDGGKIGASRGGGNCVDTQQSLIVSAIADSKSPLKRAELRFIHEGDSLNQYTAIRMKITNMTLGDKTLYSITGSIPWELMKGATAIKYWLHAINADIEVSDSEKFLLSVRTSYSVLGNLEFDVVTIKVEGSELKPIAYFTNTIAKPSSGAISLLVDGKTVFTSQPQVFLNGETAVELRWLIPKVGQVKDYQLEAKGEFCGRVFETDEVNFSSFPRMVIEPLSDKINIKLFTNKEGEKVARASSLYSSQVNPTLRFKVVSPEGTCLIGGSEKCVVHESTFGKRGNFDSVLVDGQVYRIRYSGIDNVIERFSITSIDPIVGDWQVNKEARSGIIPGVSAEELELPKKPILSFVDPQKDPQYYLDRYYNEPNYKDWFDRNYSDYTIEEAVGLSVREVQQELDQTRSDPISSFFESLVDSIANLFGFEKEDKKKEKAAKLEKESLLKIKYRAQPSEVTTGFDLLRAETQTIEFAGTIEPESTKKKQPINFFDIIIQLRDAIPNEPSMVLVYLGTNKTINALDTANEYLDEQPLDVSVITKKPIQFTRAELRFVYDSQPYEEYSAIKLNVDKAQESEGFAVLTGSVPWRFIFDATKLVYWIHFEGPVDIESDKFTIKIDQDR